jgi:hypothetical protein
MHDKNGLKASKLRSALPDFPIKISRFRPYFQGFIGSFGL